MADWTETYRPETLDEIRGNDSARDELREWASAWPEEGRAVVLSGSPGVGKTSAAHALANEMGWEAVEVNASDSRTKDTVERLVGRASRNTTLGGGGRQLLVVDEADSFHRADSGGARALSDIVGEAAQPVVLIVNDEYEMPDGLRRSLDVIDFHDVSKRSILPVLRNICRQEGVEYDDAALDAIADQNSGDLRGAINDLQALAGGGQVREGDVTTGDRDRTTGIFEFLDAVIKEEDARGALQASYAVDETPDDLVAWIEDNVPKDYSGGELVRAYRSLSAADKWLGRVRATQDYSYWRYAGAATTAGVAAARDGTKGGWTRYGPPSYWSKLGRTRGTRDTRDAVAREIAAANGTSIATARRELLPFLAAMTHHCRNRELTVAMAAAYDLDAEQVAFVTGSGEDTNKVQSIVADARERRDAAAVEASGGAFDAPEGNAASGDAEAEDDETEGAEPEDATESEAEASGDESDDGGEVEDAEEESGRQAGLSDFG